MKVSSVQKVVVAAILMANVNVFAGMCQQMKSEFKDFNSSKATDAIEVVSEGVLQGQKATESLSWEPGRVIAQLSIGNGSVVLGKVLEAGEVPVAQINDMVDVLAATLSDAQKAGDPLELVAAFSINPAGKMVFSLSRNVQTLTADALNTLDKLTDVTFGSVADANQAAVNAIRENSPSKIAGEVVAFPFLLIGFATRTAHMTVDFLVLDLSGGILMTALGETSNVACEAIGTVADIATLHVSSVPKDIYNTGYSVVKGSIAIVASPFKAIGHLLSKKK